MDTLEAIATRRSIRRFRDDPLPDDVLTRILEAAAQAPSGKNRQPWHFGGQRGYATCSMPATNCVPGSDRTGRWWQPCLWDIPAARPRKALREVTTWL